MFSCCFRVRGASDVKNEKIRGHDGDHGGSQRSWVYSWLQRIWPFGQKEKTLSQGSQGQDRIDQVEKESASKVPKEAAPEDMNEFVPNNLKVSGPKDPEEYALNDPKETAPKDTESAPRDPKSPFNSLGVLVDSMLSSMQDEDRHSLIAFLCTSSMNTIIQQVLDLLFRGYDCEEDEEIKNIIRTLLDTWVDEVPEDFSKTSELSIMKKVKTYLMLNMLYTDVLVSVYERHTKSKTSGQ